MTEVTSRASLVFATLLTLSCGAGGDAVPRAALCEELTDALCLGNVDCCDDPVRQAADLASCREQNLLLCELTLGVLPDAPGIAYDATAAGMLAAAIEASAQSCAAVPDLGIDELYGRSEEPPRGLGWVLSGTLVEGEACGAEHSSSLACTSGLVCSPDEEMTGGLGGLAGMGPGHCAPPAPPPGLGEACSSFGTSMACSGGAVCASCAFFAGMDCPEEPGVGEGRCVAPGALGEACDFLTCGSGLYCEGRLGAEPGSCAEAKVEGESCEGPRQCQGRSCEAGVCGPTPPARSHCAVWRGRIG